VVDLSGHVAMGLLFALPAWFRWHGRRSLGFVLLAGIAALAPDIDLWLVALFPGEIHHHGVTHTILFVAILSAVAAIALAGTLSGRINAWLAPEGFERSRLTIVAFLAVLTGGLSHLFADMLSAPDISTPIEPLWPLTGWTWGVDLVWYNARWINLGFLTVILAVHLVVAYATTPDGDRHRLVPF
jgi:membrane-bound metal-dependent hydrolase YbcI (DUF457 family)